jgi:glycosyltransferase involved in cell wall biosynthesis
MTSPAQDLPHKPPPSPTRGAFGLGGGVSLIIPVQDEASSIEALIQSINSQTLPPDEVLIVDAGSADETIQRAHAVPIRVSLRIIEAGRIYPGVARNTGAAASKLEWIAFTDGGIVLERDWLAGLAAAIGEGTAVVYGSYEPVCDSFFKQCAAVAYVPGKRPEGIRGPSVASCLVRRSAFEAVGGFPPYRAAEDLIFINRLQHQGFAAYSYHNLVAGWGRHWHLGLAKLYGLLGLATAVAVLVGLSLLTGLLLPFFFIGRAIKAAWVKRGSFDFRTLTAGRVLGAAGVLVIVDAATLCGYLRWLWLRLGVGRTFPPSDSSRT